MADVKWIKIVTDIFDDEKIRLIESLPEHDTILVIWFKLLCLAGKSNTNGFLMMNDKIHYTDDMLIALFNRPKTTVMLALKTFEDFGMIEVMNGIRVSNWEKHQNIDGLDKIREQNRIRQQRFRDKALLNAENNVTDNVGVTHCNGTDKDKELDKEKKRINTLFDSEECKAIRKAFPGTKTVNVARKKLPSLVDKYSFDQMLRTVERYKRDVENKRKTQPNLSYLNESTFWNGRFEDYLDENWTEPKPITPTVKPTKFHNFEAHDYDYDDLEAKMRNKRKQAT